LEQPPSRVDGLDEDPGWKDWKKVFVLMMVMCSLPALIVVIAFVVHKISVHDRAHHQTPVSLGVIARDGSLALPGQASISYTSI